MDMNQSALTVSTLLIAGLCLVGWTFASHVMKKVCQEVCGDKICFEGTAVWLSAYKLVTQAAVLPCLFYFIVDSCGWSSDGCDSAVGSSWLDVAFVGCFFLFIVDDFVCLELDTSMMLHHGACLVGICIGYAFNHAGFYHFAAGITTFELGSGSLNLYCLNSESDLLLAIYAAGMTMSNVIGTYCSALWFMSVPCAAQRVIGSFLVVFLISFRQINLYRTWRMHIARRQILRRKVYRALDREARTAIACVGGAETSNGKVSPSDRAKPQEEASATVRRRYTSDTR
jgi:hypothetical protein